MIKLKRKGQPFFEKGSKIFMGKDTTRYGTTELMQYIMPFYFHDVNKIADFETLGNPEINDKAAEYTDAAMFGTEYLFPELSQIKVPTLVIVGDDDFVCDKISQADRIHKQIPSSDEIVIKDAAHFSWVEHPTQFFGETEKWLKKQKLTAQKQVLQRFIALLHSLFFDALDPRNGVHPTLLLAINREA